MFLGLEILLVLVLLIGLLIGGIFAYAGIEKRKYENLSDTKDLKERIAKLAEPYMARRPQGALVIAVLQNGKEHVQGFAGGVAGVQPNGSTVFEIGSITKVFTAVTAAKLAADGLIKLDDPVSKCFPSDVNVPKTITFKHLATHSSGLPRLPDNFFAVATNSANPYILYKKEHLYGYLRTARKIKPAGEDSGYSNLGFGLLGHALALCAGKPYETLVREHLLAPLGMNNTSVNNKNVVPGHDPKGKVTPNWNFDVMAPAGVFRSNADDMLKFLRANLDPDRTPIAAALRECKKRHFKNIGLAWQFHTGFEGLTFIWHNGGTGGYRSFIGFDSQHESGVVLLSNYGDAFANDSSLDKMGFEILKLASKISL
jgi:serine-type D-Ala-D-Ala carboxypeptidase/endopeptidase